MRSYRILAFLISILFLFSISLSTGVPRQSRAASFYGRLQAAEFDNFDNSGGSCKHKRSLFLNTPGGELFELDSPSSELAGAALGQQIRVQGFLRNGKLVIEEYESVHSLQAATSAVVRKPAELATQGSETLGGQKTLVALLNFTDVPDKPFTVESIKAKIISATASSDNFLRENSYGKLWLDAYFVDWHTVQGYSTQLCTGAT